MQRMSHDCLLQSTMDDSLLDPNDLVQWLVTIWSSNILKIWKTLLKKMVEFILSTHIFNYDETNFSDDPGIKKSVFKYEVKYAKQIKDISKTLVSIMYCGFAAGRFLPCYVVYKSEHLWSTCIECGLAGTRYHGSCSGWFDTCCFTNWFETVCIPCTKSLLGKKIITEDNPSSHFTERVLSLVKKHNIEFACLPLNSTHLLQSLDVTFYGSLKHCWKKGVG